MGCLQQYRCKTATSVKWLWGALKMAVGHLSYVIYIRTKHIEY